jgi:oligopeptidase B
MTFALVSPTGADAVVSTVALMVASRPTVSKEEGAVKNSLASSDVKIRGRICEPMPRPFPRKFTAHGDVRVDEWHWLANAESSSVLAHVAAENSHTRSMLADQSGLVDQLYAETCAHEGVAYTKPTSKAGGYLYFKRETPGSEYESYWRKGSEGEELLLDPNELVRDGYLSIGSVRVSPDGTKMAYTIDRFGGMVYELVILRLAGRRELTRISRASEEGCWTPDGQYFYGRIKKDATADQIWAWAPRGGARKVMTEGGPGMGLGVRLSSDHSMVLISAESYSTSEVWYIPADDLYARPLSVAGRIKGVHYNCEYHSKRGLWVTVTDLGAPDQRLVCSEEPQPLVKWREYAAEIPGCGVDRLAMFDDYLVLSEHYEGDSQLRVVPLGTGKEFVIRGSDVAGKGIRLIELCDFGEFKRNTVWFSTEGGAVPRAYWRYSLKSRKASRISAWRVGGGFSAREYHTAREWATGEDGTKIPISIVKRRDTPVNGTAPCLMKVYGAYGDPSDQYYSPSQLTLLDRGFVLAIAHVRGGGELGSSWHDGGKLANKDNTFTDTIACAKHLLAKGWSRKGGLCLRGGSAGGLAVGTALNRAPELFKAVIVESPFLDLVTTMMNPKLPLVVAEYDEWGNPKEAQVYWRLKRLSPYDNVREVDYPAVLAFTSLHDPFVGFHESLKWVLRLRERTTSANPLLVKIDLEGAHTGKSGRYENLYCEAELLAFLCAQVGITE